MKIIAQQPDQRYLVQTAKDKAFILDLKEERRWPEFNLQSLLARGYWEEFDGDQKPILRQMASLGKSFDFDYSDPDEDNA